MPWRGRRRAPADVTALVGHELSTPIATALLYLRIASCHCARPGAPSGLARSAVQVACGELERLKHLLDRVIELERLGQAVVRPERVDLGAVVRGAVERAVGAVADAVLRDAVEVQAPSGFVGWWDDVAVEQILRNLLSNAFKFGQGRPIRVVLAPTRDGAEISVRDGGIGIRAVSRERIFERRRRAPASVGGGLGLGLWVVRELATAHGGSATVESRPGHGSTFHVHLPELSPAASVETPRLPVRAGARRAPAAAPVGDRTAGGARFWLADKAPGRLPRLSSTARG